MNVCLDQFSSASSASDAPVHSPWAKKFCDPSSALYLSSVAFAMGESRTNLPLWWSSACTMICWILVDISTERQHALAKKVINNACNHSEPYFSLALRIPCIERALEEDPDHLLQLGECANSVTFYKDVISQFRSCWGIPMLIKT